MTTKTILETTYFDKLNFNRTHEAGVLVALNFVSLVTLYITVGWHGGGHSPEGMPAWFWITEASMWGVRALVEGWTLFYLFRTVTDTSLKAGVLMVFEFLLIAGIVFTLGLTIAANVQEVNIGDLGNIIFWWWSFTVAAISPLMLGSIGFAHRVHIDPKDDLVLVQSDLVSLQSDLVKAEAETKRFKTDLEKANDRIKALQSDLTSVYTLPDLSEFDLDKAGDRAKAVLLLTKNFEGVENRFIASLAQCSPATVTGAAKSLNGKLRREAV